AAAVPLAGKALDRYGARRVMYWTFIASVVICFFLSYPATSYVIDGIEGPIAFRLVIELPVFVALTVLLLRILPGGIGTNLMHQYRIFRHPHTWAMTVIYTMTFGSFIGFSAAFPLAIKVIFGFQHVADAGGVMTHDLVNPNGPSALMFAWMGPFIGALIRPVGGWVADRIGGALVTQFCALVRVGMDVAETGHGQRHEIQIKTPTRHICRRSVSGPCCSAVCGAVHVSGRVWPDRGGYGANRQPEDCQSESRRRARAYYANRESAAAGKAFIANQSIPDLVPHRQ
ncbi:MAG: hypothetical protein ACPHQ8_11645, partial [Candidatus Puniceispirillaceae bacterium]